MTKQEKDQKIEEIFNIVPIARPISDVIERYVAKTSKGYPCPFHQEKSVGGFKVNEKDNYCNCFSCSQGGNNIKVFSIKENISYFEAGIQLGLEYGVLNLSEYHELFGKDAEVDLKKEGKKYKHISLTIDNKENPELKRKKSSKEINAVYEVFKSFSVLTNEHKKHLLEERKLTEEEIEKNKFFSMPETSIMKDFLKEIENKNLSLNGVPGFFQKRNSKGVWEWKYSYTKGICMPFFNENKEIIGIQVRKDKGTGNRYIWFSSSRAMNSLEEGEYDDIYKGNVKYGMTPGAPISEISKKEYLKPYIIIGEGIFKILTATKELSVNGLALGGVNSQGDIKNRLNTLIKKYEKTHNKKIKNIFLAFDADMQSNLGISKALKKLYNTIISNEVEYKVEILSWKEEDGKGIDDLIFNGKISTIKRYDAKLFLDTIDKYSQDLPKLKPKETYKEEDIKNLFDKVFTELNSLNIV